MNLIGYWHSEDQVRVGEYERTEFEEIAGKVNKIAKMLVRMVALEGLTEALFKEGDNIQCGLEDMRLGEMMEPIYNWIFLSWWLLQSTSFLLR